MSYLALKNERKRRRQAKVLTAIITTTALVGAAYGLGAADQLVETIQQLMHTAPAAVPVA